MTTTSPRTKPPARNTTSAVGDKVFKGMSWTGGVIILVVLAFVALFLLIRSLPAIAPDTFGPGADEAIDFWSYVWPLMAGTIIVSAIALLLATPIAIGVSLFISHYAPRRFANTIGYIIDLLAAIPSVVYGAWGMLVLAPLMVPLYQWLHNNLGFIPLFAGDPSTTGRTIMTSGVVLAVMVLPIMTALCREIFLQVPHLQEEAALGLGATRWEMIKMTVFPFARAGIISSIMLALGRALGETMAVTMVLSPGAFSWSLLTSGVNATIPSEIALNFPEAFGQRQSELIAAGLMLFVITLIVNVIARAIVNSHAKKAEGMS
ncbi:MAG TPA: phosphate ABC transporter permease subunit PstC [Enteractinococcus helveticum]|uniref:Phosphate transport system permease protein n=1 Tax=Enteractinococcus helveticum TaxID=1837282 RepID=A0A921K814_9MICC|nr:phosphate ABC transporter permease subunit PstC [Enteractinococcus helveticum]HJF15307.1 phosphate ABC transporter permease subunit PstC [Enteractinococcus helveticum]